jgi:four helix bundle protein
MPITHHSQLVCYQLGARFRRAVYDETAKPGWRKDWRLRDDLRRAARSVPTNISEGYWRYHHRDFAHFLDIALGSLGEAEDHLETALVDRIIDEAPKATLVALIREARTPTLNLRDYLSRTTAPPRSVKAATPAKHHRTVAT